MACKTSNFKRLKNREDSSDFDDFWTESLALTRTFFCISASSGRSFVVRRDFFSSTRKFRRRENFRTIRSGHRDRFRPKIVEIGAILAIFEPFKVRKFTRHFWANSADRPRIYANLLTIRANPGTIG